MPSVSDELTISGDLGEVYECFWNPRLWAAITPHVKSIQMLEEATGFQQFIMEIESGGKLYRTESKRIGIPFEKIQYEQLQPPPFLTRHTGSWTFRRSDDGIRVTLVHNFEIDAAKASECIGTQSSSDAQQQIGAALKKNGLITMNAIKRWIEG